MLLLQILFAVLCFAQSNQCANDCRIEKKDNGTHFVACQCSAKLKPWSKQSNEIFFRSRLAGATAEETKFIQENRCAKAPAPSPEEASKLRPIATRPLCECVSARLQVGVEANCKKSSSGEKLCQPRHTGREGKPRKPTLFDYQSCVVDRVNYKKPETCAEAVCAKEKPTCADGQELVNIADPEACCPVFTCRTSP
jgi:hypothetical protein